jgi:hypothetical protein
VLDDLRVRYDPDRIELSSVRRRLRLGDVDGHELHISLPKR